MFIVDNCLFFVVFVENRLGFLCFLLFSSQTVCLGWVMSKTVCNVVHTCSVRIQIRSSAILSEMRNDIYVILTEYNLFLHTIFNS